MLIDVLLYPASTLVANGCGVGGVRGVCVCPALGAKATQGLGP